jgi:hypothetical protein
MFSIAYSPDIKARDGKIFVEYADFKHIDRMANNIPEKYTHNPKDLASYIKGFTKTDLEFVRALYVWFSSPTGIDYDYDCLFKRKSRPSQLSLPVMKAKLGVCVGYSNIMVDACRSVGIMSEVVGGNVYSNDKEGDTKPYAHAWVIVKINGKYGLIDPTWGATFAMKDSVHTKEKSMRRVNNAYFFFHPFEHGSRREADIPEFNLREPGIYSDQRNEIPNNIYKAIKQYPVLRKIIDDMYADANMLMPINRKVNEEYRNSKDLNQFYSKVRHIPTEYFLAKYNHIQISHSGYLLNILSGDMHNNSKNLISLDIDNNDDKGLLTKQLMFFVQKENIESLLK